MQAVTVLKSVGTQQLVAATNRMRHFVGASELVRRATTEWPHDAAVRAGVAAPAAVSGQCVLTGEADATQQVVREVTERALREAPGIELAGITLARHDPARVAGAGVAGAVAHALRRVETARGELCFGRRGARLLPPLQPCAQTPYPAAPGDGREPLSLAAQTRAAAADDAYARFRDELGARGVGMPADLGAFEAQLETSWVAVVCLDGDQLGSLVHTATQRLADEDFLDAYPPLTAAVDELFYTALTDAAAAQQAPVLPVVRGGDDLVFVCAGQHARTLTERVLATIDEQSPRQPTLQEALAEAQREALTASAGIAVIGPHFPFHAGYQLAAALADRAKQARPAPRASAFDVRVHYDPSAPVTLERRADDGLALAGGPYTIAADGDLARTDDLARQVTALTARTPQGQAAVPPALVDEGMRRLADGADTADRWLAAQRGRATAALARLTHPGGDDAPRLHTRGRTLLLNAKQLADVETPSPRRP
jgi:hypothetical protein